MSDSLPLITRFEPSDRARQMRRAWNSAVIFFMVAFTCAVLTVFLSPGPIGDTSSYQFAGLVTAIQIGIWGPLFVAMRFAHRDIASGLPSAREPRSRPLLRRFIVVALPSAVLLLAATLFAPANFLPFISVEGARLRLIVIATFGLITITPGWLGLLAGTSVAMRQARATQDVSLLPATLLVEQHLLLRAAIGRIRLALGIGFSGTVIALGLFWNAESNYLSTQLARVTLASESELSAQLNGLDADLEIALSRSSDDETSGQLRADHIRMTGSAIAESERTVMDAKDELNSLTSASLYGWALLLVGMMIYMYWPTHAAVDMAGRRIVDGLRPLGDPRYPADFDEIIVSRSRLEGLLGMGASGRAAVERAAFALSPLIVAFFTQLFV